MLRLLQYGTHSAGGKQGRGLGVRGGLSAFRLFFIFRPLSLSLALFSPLSPLTYTPPYSSLYLTECSRVEALGDCLWG